MKGRNLLTRSVGWCLVVVGGVLYRKIHIYGSVQGGGSEQRELDYFTEAVQRVTVDDPGPKGVWCGGRGQRCDRAEVVFGWGRRAGGLIFQLLRDFECWMSHCSVISEVKGKHIDGLVIGITKRRQCFKSIAAFLLSLKLRKLELRKQNSLNRNMPMQKKTNKN